MLGRIVSAATGVTAEAIRHPQEVPSATARSLRRPGQRDARLVAAFLAGMLIASVVLGG